jgi:hypothetical protein
MKSGIGHQLKAWGRFDLPQNFVVDQTKYCLERVFKNDFFAATLLFCQSDNQAWNKKVADRIVLKLGRRIDFLGLPLEWLGRGLIEHEISILQRLQQISGVPRFLGRYEKWGLLYEYIPGKTLDQRPDIPDTFFDQLGQLIQQIHACRVAYVDMNKRGNIILADTGCPGMIDYQISWYVPHRVLGFKSIASFILGVLQREDIYHVFKHKRRLRRDLMDDEQMQQSRRISRWISLHRAGARPLTKLRRRILGFLFRRGRLVTDKSTPPTPETDPTRWTK